MASSDVEICNIALTGYLGHHAISSIGEAGKAGALTAIHYTPTRDALLRSHPWNFATRHVDLAQDGAYTPAFDYTYAYTLPTDCLKVIRTELEALGYDHDYRIEAKPAGGRVLLTDETTCAIEYTSNATAVGEYDAMFVQLLALQLAVIMCMQITDNSGLLERLGTQLKDMRSMAQTTDAQEGKPRDIVDQNSWLYARL